MVCERLVFGPAYLDRVVRVDRPLVSGRQLDGSVDGVLHHADRCADILDRGGSVLRLGRMDLASRPLGRVQIDGMLGEGEANVRNLEVISDRDDLGGMGAGYASAFGGSLVVALGPVGDPIGSRVQRLLSAHRIGHWTIRVADHPSDWSLIVSSGRFGDKLAIGFRGCNAALPSVIPFKPECPRLLVVAGLPNRVIANALRHRAELRFVAPAMRNARDCEPPLSDLAGQFDVMSLNRAEWDAMPDREAIREQTPIVVVTDGPKGCSVLFRDRDGRPETMSIPAFPRASPPRDTNRAGEALAAAFVRALMRGRWRRGETSPELVRSAIVRGSAAAALVLGREDFGFATDSEIDAALLRGVVEDTPLDDPPSASLE